MGRAGKWNEERRAQDKLKKQANKAYKDERRFNRLLLRADKLEAQAQKLMKEAKIARARHEIISKQRAVSNFAPQPSSFSNPFGMLLVLFGSMFC